MHGHQRMPHRPKSKHDHVSQTDFQEVHDKIDCIIAEVAVLKRKVEQIEAREYTFEEKAESVDISSRIERLEQIYVLVDFVKLENVCDRIFLEHAPYEFSDGSKILEVVDNEAGANKDASHPIPYAAENVFEYLEGIGADSFYA